jgi:hypothetical protein
MDTVKNEQRDDRGTALRELRRARPEHTSQTAAAALLGLTPRQYTFLEGGRLTLSEGDWRRVMEVIRG